MPDSYLLSVAVLRRMYASTVAELLTAAGLTVQASAENDCAELLVSNPRLGHEHTLELTVRDDRSVEWTLDAGDDLLEGTSARALATLAANLLSVPRA